MSLNHRQNFITMVSKWAKKGRISLEDDTREEHLTTASALETVAKKLDMILEDHRLT